MTVEEFDRETIRELAEHVCKYTIQIFRTNSEEGTVAHGCGILFQFQENYFLLTAGHNYKGENINELKIRVDEQLLAISGETLLSKSNDSNVDDKIDIAITKLDDDLSKSLLKSNSKFALISDISLGPQQKISGEKNSNDSDYYFILGYPGGKTKLKYGSNKDWSVQVFFANGYLYNTNIIKLKDKGYDNHLFINRLQKIPDIISGQKTHVPKLNGMSGSGLWDIKGYDLKAKALKCKLVGIFIEENLNVRIYTKIDFAIEMIRHRYNLVKLPKSTL